MKKVVAVCGVACAFAAGTAFAAGPRSSMPVPGTMKVLQTARHAGTLKPIRVAKFRTVGDRMILTTPWMVPQSGGSGDAVPQPAFDCFEADTLGNPTGFLTCGANSSQPFCLPPNPPCTNDVRWFFGATNPPIPYTANDMVVGSGFNGADASRVLCTVNWGTTPAPLFVAVATHEDFGSCVLPAVSNEIDGVVADFGIQTGGAGYFTLDLDLSMLPIPTTIGLPADGSGAYTLKYGTAFNSTTGEFTLATAAGVQSMLWGTGEDEPTPDGRIGTQGPAQWDDDTPANGQFTANECFQNTFTGICPGQLGPMALFFAEQASCYPDCDGSGTLTIADFGCFQTKFVQNDPYADCDGSGTLTIADFGCFQTKFVQGCP